MCYLTKETSILAEIFWYMIRIARTPHRHSFQVETIMFDISCSRPENQSNVSNSNEKQYEGESLLMITQSLALLLFTCPSSSWVRCECAAQVWSCAWNLDDPQILYAGLNSGRVQVFDRREVANGETTLSSSVETLSLSSQSPIVSLQYIQKSPSFHSSGLLVGSSEKCGFYEHLSNREYRYHALPIESSWNDVLP